MVWVPWLVGLGLAAPAHAEVVEVQWCDEVQSLTLVEDVVTVMRQADGRRPVQVSVGRTMQTTSGGEPAVSYGIELVGLNRRERAVRTLVAPTLVAFPGQTAEVVTTVDAGAWGPCGFRVVIRPD